MTVAVVTNNETMTIPIFNELAIKKSNQMTKIALAYAHRSWILVFLFTTSRKVTKESQNLRNPISSKRNFKVVKLRFVSMYD